MLSRGGGVGEYSHAGVGNLLVDTLAECKNAVDVSN